MNNSTIKNKEDLQEIVKQSVSYSQVLQKLELSPTGGNYRILKRLLKGLEIDTSHFSGQGYLKGKTHNWSKKIPLEEILKEGTHYQSYKLKNRLLKEKFIENKCSECGLLDEWNGKTINHQLDHINGDNTDNRIENLRLLCPNCHSQTETYCGKNKTGRWRNR